MARIQDIIVYKAEDVIITFTMTPEEDITGWTIMFTVKKSYASLDPLFIIQATLSDPANGEFQIPILSENNSISTGHFIYDAVRVDDGARTVLSAGAYIVNPGVRYS